ncbi:MAG: DUF4091 domain-containing protein, partial [Clostridia bacterium]|nr:DUF4091 domain-containing protein [Clostridia bacterium]
MKRTLISVITTVLTLCLCAGIFSVSADEISDPSEIYTPQKAEYEDSSISLWFEHSFKKVMTSDTDHSGMHTYSVYMGKNEIENAQFVLYSNETKEKMRASVADFKDANGNTVDAELYYQMYVTLDNLNTLNYPGATEESSFIRNGEQPDPMVPASKIGRFQLNAGKSQAFYIRLKTNADTVSGWYSSQLNVYNSAGQVVKTATVYAYVWDFTISEKTELQSSIYLSKIGDAYGSYKEYYDYFLENRLVMMDVPGQVNSSNPYLTNDRVSAIRVSAVGGGNDNKYLDEPALYSQYADIYDDVSSMAEWEEIKDKFYFYTLDECLHPQYGGTGSVDDVKARSERLDQFWPNAAKVVPYHINHLYPYDKYTLPMSSYDPSQIKDATQEMIDSASVTIWCPRYYAYTPLSELNRFPYDMNDDSRPVRNLSGIASGNFLAGEWTFMWENIYGDYKDRIVSNTILRNENGDNNDRNWIYSAGNNGGYTYPNHLIENTGLQTKMMFWHMYRDDITGYLYYGANSWDEYNKINDNYVDTTVTGNRKGAWKTNLRPNYPYLNGHPVYGNGVLFYTATQGSLTTVDYIGTVRVEMMRDGIEEYQMLTMLEKLCGNKASDAIVDSVFNSVVDYISLPCFDRSAFSNELDDYDVMAMTRIELGNQLEAASKKICEHKYDEGVVTKEPTCLVMGERTYTCTLCGAEQSEYIPTLHAVGDCFDVTVVKEAECTVDGQLKYECTVCEYAKYETVTAYHNDKDVLEYTANEKMPNVHDIICPECKEKINNVAHTYITEYTNTCVDAGVQNDVCIYCGHTEKVADVEAHGHNMIETYEAPTCTEAGYSGGKCYNCGHEEGETIAALGHKYVDGKCENCGEADPDASQVEMGDIDGNGNINSVDLFKMNLYVKQVVAPTEAEEAAADIDENG